MQGNHAHAVSHQGQPLLLPCPPRQGEGPVEFGQGKFQAPTTQRGQDHFRTCVGLKSMKPLRFQCASHLGGVVDVALHDEGVLGPNVHMGTQRRTRPVVPNLA